MTQTVERRVTSRYLIYRPCASSSPKAASMSAKSSLTPYTCVRLNFSAPLRTLVFTLTYGVTPESTSGYCSTSSAISSGSAVRDEPGPRPMTITCTRFVPIFSNCSFIIVCMPFPRLVMMITAATPIIMPSMVRIARALLLIRDLTASLKFCSIPIRAYPPLLPRKAEPQPVGRRRDHRK